MPTPTHALHTTTTEPSRKTLQRPHSRRLEMAKTGVAQTPPRSTTTPTNFPNRETASTLRHRLTPRREVEHTLTPSRRHLTKTKPLPAHPTTQSPASFSYQRSALDLGPQHPHSAGAKLQRRHRDTFTRSATNTASVQHECARTRTKLSRKAPRSSSSSSSSSFFFSFFTPTQPYPAPNASSQHHPGAPAFCRRPPDRGAAVSTHHHGQGAHFQIGRAHV